MIRRPPRSTQSRSSAASDVYKRQVLSIASDERVSCDEEKDFADILKNINEVKQAISDMELWVYRNQDLLRKREIASAVTLTIKR